MPDIKDDVLSRLLSNCRAERAVSAKFVLSGPWALQSTGTEGVLIRMCTGAPYYMQLAGEAPVLIGPRDIVILPKRSSHQIFSEPGLPPIAFSSLLATHVTGKHGDHPIVFAHGGGGVDTVIFALHLWMPMLDAGSVFGKLPALVVLRSEATGYINALAIAMESIVEESIAQLPGWQLSAARMADLLLTQILREYLKNESDAQKNAMRGVDDKNIGKALARIYETPGAAWTVMSLAKESGLSRTIFSERFRQLLGDTPMNYLCTQRMIVAAEKLKDRRMSICAVAESVGYQSEKTFAKAFQRWSGLTPSAFSRKNS